MQRTVTAAWEASYPDPIRVRAGEPVTLGGKEHDWKGHVWLWARSRDGKEGWIPDDLLEPRDGALVARRDFDAMELTCRRGEALEALSATHGWVLCRAEDGRTGWVPEENLAFQPG